MNLLNSLQYSKLKVLFVVACAMISVMITSAFVLPENQAEPGACEICGLDGHCSLVAGSTITGTDYCVQWVGPARCEDQGSLCND